MDPQALRFAGISMPGTSYTLPATLTNSTGPDHGAAAAPKSPNYNEVPPSTPGFGNEYDFSDSDEDLDSTSSPSLICPLTLDASQEKRLAPSLISGGSARGSSSPKIENQPHELDTPRELVAATAIKDSYFEARLKHVEYATWGAAGAAGVQSQSGRPACLMVLEINFQPRMGGSKRRRFSEANVEVEFEDAPIRTTEATTYRNNYANGVYTGPTILKFAPTVVQGAQTIGQQTTSFGLSISPDPGSIVPGLAIQTPSLLPALSYKNTTVAPKTGALLIHGVLRSDPPRRVVWSISENEVEKGGIPRRIRLAIIVGYHDSKRFCMKVRMKAHLVGWKGLWAVKAVQGGYKDAPVYFNPGQMIQKGIGVGEHAERSREGILELGPAAQAHEAEVLAEMKNLIGGTISIWNPVNKGPGDVNSQPAGGMVELSEHPSGGDHQWNTWVPEGLKTQKSFESSVTLVDDGNHVRDLKDIDVGGLTKRSQRDKAKR